MNKVFRRVSAGGTSIIIFHTAEDSPAHTRNIELIKSIAMEPNKILKSDLLDLVFDNRNKAYGAYELRVTYPQRIKRSLLITLGIGAMIFTGIAWTTAGKSKAAKGDEETVYVVRAVPNDPPPPIPPPPPA